MENNFDFDSLMQDTITNSNKGGKGGKKKVKEKQNTNKKKVKAKQDTNKKPIKASKVVLCVVVGLIVSGMFFLLIGGLYTRYVRFPKEKEVDKETTGMYALENFEAQVHELDLPENYYLFKETVYANSSEEKLAFINSVVATVHYEPDVVNAENVYGNDLVDKESMGIVTRDSYVTEGEEVTLHYIDYSKIDFNKDKILSLISEYGLEKDDVNYSNSAVLLFCKYISNEGESLPKTSQKRAPYIIKDGGRYVVQEDEDVFLDKLLFSSDEFRDCEMRFTEALGEAVLSGEAKETETVQPTEPAKDNKEKATEPDKKTIFSPSEEWVKWNELPKADKEKEPEPLKYGKMTMSISWCGAYFLENEYYTTDDNGNKIRKKLSPQLGNGTLESPASIGTPVITSVLSTDKDGNLIEDPIRVELVDFGVSEDAITWFQSKDIQNRGYILDSEVQYAYYIFKVTNLSDKTLTVKDNSSLCDKNINLSTRTGTIFGITESLTLKPDESGYIESWGRSTELNRKYVIWGKDFERRKDPVWFRVLAGDLEDTSEDKGVYLIERIKKSQDKEEVSSNSESAN